MTGEPFITTQDMNEFRFGICTCRDAEKYRGKFGGTQFIITSHAGKIIDSPIVLRIREIDDTAERTHRVLEESRCHAALDVHYNSTSLSLMEYSGYFWELRIREYPIWKHWRRVPIVATIRKNLKNLIQMMDEERFKQWWTHMSI